MKKILIYIDSMKAAGGIERVISNLVNNWVEKYSILILVKDEAESFYNLDARIQIETIRKPLKLNMQSRLSRIISLIKNIFISHRDLKKVIGICNPDIIYTANPVNSLEICLLGKKYSRRLIISEHGSKFGYNGIYNLIKKFVYPRAYKISVPTTLDTKLYKEEGLPAVFIPHLSTYKNDQKADCENKQILNVGRLTRDKQQIDLLKIWNSIVMEKKHGDWRLLIVGRGEEEPSLRKYIDENRLSDTVTIVNPNKDIAEIFKLSSIFAFTSQYEGFGMVLLEAMSFGVPCISFNCPSGPRDIIDDGINGYLIDNRNFEEYKTKLLDLMGNDNRRKKLGEASFIKANNWDNKEILRKWDDLFSFIE